MLAGELPSQKTGQTTQLGTQQDLELQELSEEMRKHTEHHRSSTESKEWILSQISRRRQHAKTAGQEFHRWAQDIIPATRWILASTHPRRGVCLLPTQVHIPQRCTGFLGPTYIEMSRRKGRPFENINILFFS